MKPEPITGLSPRELLAGGLTSNDDERIGSYEIVAPLGEGGMGLVYLAVQLEPVRREVALKLIKRGMDTDALLARFELERQTLAGLDHPGIARVFDAGATDGGRPYFVMELVEGVAVTEYAQREGIDRDGRIRLLLQACAAVEHAHRRGVIHRDLKPSNLLVDEEGALKVIDFGLAKLTRQGVGAAQTLAGEVFGTPGYMAPEQAAGEEVDTRSDVFALGCVLRELVGEQGELRWVIAKAVEEDASRRYGSVTELAEDLRRFLDLRPLSAGPPSTSYRLGKFVRRHRAACAAGIALLFGGGYGIWKGIEAAHFRTQADTAMELGHREWSRAHNATMFAHEMLTAMDVDDPDERREALRVAVRYFEENLMNRGADPEGEFIAMEMLGMSYKALDEFEDALRCLQRAVDLGHFLDEQRPGDAVPAWYLPERLLGELMAEKGDFHQAAGILDSLDRHVCARAGRQYPERRVLLVSRAEAFDGAGMDREAKMVRDGLGDMANFSLE